MLREERDIFDLNPIRKRSIKISDLEVYRKEPHINIFWESLDDLKDKLYLDELSVRMGLKGYVPDYS